jgi:hypothetical protein
LFALFFPTPCRAGWSATSFIVVAHADDWQLFFNPDPWKRVRTPGMKSVFVYTTAGDAGLGTGPADKPYFAAREEGARRAVRFMANLDSLPAQGAVGVAQINGHSIATYTYKNTVSYFFRLPDGNRLGTGYPATGSASLEKLRLGLVPTLSAVDGSATYIGWHDLVDTLEMLVRAELLGSGATSAGLFFQDSTTRNHGDHSDHVSSGLAMDAVAGQMSCLSATRFVDYPSTHLAVNLSSAESVDKAAVFAVTVGGITDMGHSTRWVKGYMGWLHRTYSRMTPGDGSRCFNPGAPCGPSTCGGCCDVDGICQTGTIPAACGLGGHACAACPGDERPMCVNQTCSPCDAGHLCCDGSCRPHCLAIKCPKWPALPQ